MKNLGYVFLGLLGLALAGGIGVYFLLLAPLRKAAEEIKPVLLKQTEAFVTCLVHEPAGDCKKRFISEKEHEATSTEGLALLAQKMKKNLGKRISASLNETSFRANKKVMSNGTLTTVSFSTLTNFEKDSAAVEQLTFVQAGDGPYFIHTYQLSSNQLFK